MQFSQQFEVGFKGGVAVAASLNAPPINQLHVRPRHVWQVIDLYKNMLHATAQHSASHCSALQLVAVSSCCCGCFSVCLLLNLYSPPQPGDEEERSEPACLHIDYCAHSMPPVAAACNKIERAWRKNMLHTGTRTCRDLQRHAETCMCATLKRAL